MKEEIKKELLTKLKLGTITKAEQKKLEIAALDDPFLFDALEGYVTAIHHDAPNKLNVVFERINENIKFKKPTRSIPIFLVAAAATLIILFGIFLFRSNDRQQAPFVLADHMPKVETRENETVDEKIEKFRSSEIAQQKSNNDSKSKSIKKENTNAPIIENIVQSPQVIAEEKKANEVIVQDNDRQMMNDAYKAEDEVFSAAPAGNVFKASGQEEPMSKVKSKSSGIKNIIISGKVYNEKGEAVPNVAVIAQKESTFTNVDGGFELTLDNQKQFIVFADKDYETSSIYANENEKNIKIYLKKIEAKSSDDAGDFTLFSEAVDHRFLTYLEDKEINIYNYITVFFKYEEDGNVSDIIVHNCDNYNLEDMIKLWIRDYQSLLPKSERGDVLKMLLIPE